MKQPISGAVQDLVQKPGTRLLSLSDGALRAELRVVIVSAVVGEAACAYQQRAGVRDVDHRRASAGDRSLHDGAATVCFVTMTSSLHMTSFGSGVT